MNWNQFTALLWLRWTLSRNQLRRGKTINVVLGTIAIIASVCGVIAALIGGFLGGYYLMPKATAEGSLLGFDIFTGVFLFVWVLGTLGELQRSEAIDFQRLMHLPISLPQLFVMNYIASLATPVLLIFMPAALAMTLGWACARGFGPILTLGLWGGYFFLITAWTYYLRGWLVSLMVNQRRRRAILTTITVVVIVGVQVPNLYFNVLRQGRDRHQAFPTSPARYATSEAVQWAHRLVPPLWLSKGVYELHRGDWVWLFSCTGGLWLLGGFGLHRAYRSTLRFYTREEPARPAKATSTATPPLTTSPHPVPGPQVWKPLWIEQRLPGVEDDTAAIALASCRSMLRAPEMKLALIGPVIMVFVFGAIFLRRTQSPLGPTFQNFIPTGLILMMSFGFLQLLLNQFGLDRHGFRSLALLPTPRKSLLVGKNLAYAPFYLIPGIIVLILVGALSDVPALSCFSALFQLLGMFCILCSIGNLCSIMTPFRISPGSMKPTKQPPKIVFLIFGLHILFPILALPVVIPVVAATLLAGFTSAPVGWVNLSLSLMAAGLCWLGYYASLGPLSDLFERREKEMLRVLTEEVE